MELKTGLNHQTASIRDSYIVLVENYHPLPQYIAEEFMLFVYLHWP